MPETQTSCPFCKKMSIRVLHIPFVSNTFSSNCRAGGRNTKIQKERFDILSGCSECGKTLKEVEYAFDHSTKQETHEEKLKRIKDSGLPTIITSNRNGD